MTSLLRDIFEQAKENGAMALGGSLGPDPGRYSGTGETKATTTDVDAVLEERGARYGKFEDHANLAQTLKRVVAGGRSHFTMDDDQKEALDMICHKMARIVNGDPDYADSWVDIAGYAKLVADRLNGTSR